MGISDEWKLDDEERFPGAAYTRAVLEPAYEQAKSELLGPMMAVNQAHLIMLGEQGLIHEADASRIADALTRIDLEALSQSTYTGAYEDLFFQVEHELAELAGEAAGYLHLGRSRNDMGIALYRLVLREKLLQAVSSGLFLQRELLKTAEAHTDTVMIGYTHTQQAQPTTLAHYLSAVADSLGRDLVRLQRAYSGCNRSSMGAAALTTSGFAVDRSRVAELLAFDELIVNAYDAVSGSDYVGEAAAAVQLAAVNLGRFVQELLLWCTQEFAVLRVAAPYVQISSIMPQKRNPVSVEHARALLSAVFGDAQTVLTMIHNTPFGDIVDTEDDLQPYAWRSLEKLSAVYRLLANVIATLHIRKDVLRTRAEESFATVTELADTLVRQEGLSFRQSHLIVSRTVSRVVESGGSVRDISLQTLDAAARETVGYPLKLSEEALRQALDPHNFIEVRKLPGGPNPLEVARALKEQQERFDSQRDWLEQARGSIRAAEQQVSRTISEWARRVTKLGTEAE
ncbi:argininosuccinate lyase [Paenibacillus puerhi]|uniref:argininosuccinate lyase n=1 Tax=Paenibacillus puerhi TaxID=2692622 RepID=UPI0013592BEA|nr:argininosuccinate lyase [Paenibacillus puerhi]